jgi:hypothetical protein
MQRLWDFPWGRGMGEALKVGLLSWIIQDGNYPEFRQGQTCAFALQWSALEPLAFVDPAAPLDRALTWRRENAYAVVADIEFIGAFSGGSEWCVLDAGVRLYNPTQPPGDWKVGRTVQGAVELSIDPFLYVETLAKTPRAPPLIYDWSIDRIELETTPWIETPGGVPQRDRARTRWRDVAETDAWNDDEGRANYLITCTRLGPQRRKTLGEG